MSEILGNNNGRIAVSSGRDKRRHYIVTVKDEQWRCSCKGWIFHSPRKDCKHIRLAKSGTVQPVVEYRVPEVARGSNNRRYVFT